MHSVGVGYGPTLMIPNQNRGSLIQRRPAGSSSLGTLQRRPRKAYGPAVQQWLPAREAKEVAVLYGGVCWVLMLELGGLADARPIHINNSVQQEYQSQWHRWSEAEVLGYSVPWHRNWCGPYFKRFLPVAGLSKVRPTLLWSDLLRGRTETVTTRIVKPAGVGRYSPQPQRLEFL